MSSTDDHLAKIASGVRYGLFMGEWDEGGGISNIAAADDTLAGVMASAHSGPGYTHDWWEVFDFDGRKIVAANCARCDYPRPQLEDKEPAT